MNRSANFAIECGDTLEVTSRIADGCVDLIVSSPPYNIGKSYETRTALEVYVDWQRQVVLELVRTMRDGASLAWQVGNHVEKGSVTPLDFVFIPMMMEAGLSLRNRYIWQFGHGLHAKTRFSGRHETVLWFTKGKGFYHDPNVMLPAGAEIPQDTSVIAPFVLEGMESGVWDIPNVKHNHVEKIADHPCQFPVGLAERVVLGLSRPGEIVFDPFAGVGSAGVAAVAHGRRFIGIDRDPNFCSLATDRIAGVKTGETRWRSHEMPVTRPKEKAEAIAPAQSEFAFSVP